MKSITTVLAGTGMCCLLTAQAASPDSRTLQDLMKSVVAPQTQLIWDVGGDAMMDNGDYDPAKIKAETWNVVLHASQEVSAALKSLAQRPTLVVAPPGQKIENEGLPGAWSAKQVQDAISHNGAAFKAMDQGMQTTMDDIILAAKTRDANKLATASSLLDEQCEQCHKAFWYPEQK